MDWFRWYHGTSEDGKFRMIARHAGVTVCHVVGVWASLLEDAAHVEHRGIATRGDDFYAAVLELDPAEIEQILGSMETAGIISVGIGAITITNWNERQFEIDVKDPTAAARQKRARDKRRDHAIVTPPSRRVTPASLPDTDTDTDSETERKSDDASASSARPTGSQRKVKSNERGTRLPPDWQPDDDCRAFALDLGLDPDSLIAEFRDYWCAVAGAKGVKLDWRGTWRNRCRQLAGDKPSGRGVGQPRGLSGASSLAAAAGDVISRIRVQ